MEQLQTKKCWKSFLKTQCRKNQISSHLVAAFTLLKFRKTYQKLSNMYPLPYPAKKSTNLGPSLQSGWRMSSRLISGSSSPSPAAVDS